MQKVSLLLCSITLGFACLFSHASAGQQVTIDISSPKNNATVGLSEVVQGKVSNPGAKVYVLVHPLLTNLWWVQRIPSPPNKDGAWRTACYFGTKKEGIDEQFEIVAITSDRKLKEGQMLEDLPTDAVRSDIVVVKRSR